MQINLPQTVIETPLFSSRKNETHHENAFVNRLFNQISDNVNKLELKEVFADLKSLCGGKRNLKIIKDDKDKYLCIQMLFSTSVKRELVKENLLERNYRHKSLNYDQWEEFRENNLQGLRLSYTQSALLLGRDQEYIFYTQKILESLFKLQEQSYCLTKIPVEFLSPLCSYLPLESLNQFSRTCKKLYELVHLDENNLLWVNVADQCKFIVEFDPNKSIKKQIFDPWLETPWGKINQLTYEVKVNNSYRPEPLEFDMIPYDEPLPQRNESEGLYSVLLSFFKTYIPADYYLIFDFKDVVGEVCMLFYRDESGTIQHNLFASAHTSQIIVTKNLKSHKYSIGSFENETS